MTTERIIQYWRQLRAGLLATVDKFSDEDLDYVPVAGGYSVGEIILHIAHEEYLEIQYGLTRTLDDFPDPFPNHEYQTVESVKTLLATVHDETVAYLQTLDDDDLAGEFVAQWGQTKPLIDFIVHVMEHEVHHRGELSLILGLLGREGLDA